MLRARVPNRPATHLVPMHRPSSILPSALALALAGFAARAACAPGGGSATAQRNTTLPGSPPGFGRPVTATPADGAGGVAPSDAARVLFRAVDGETTPRPLSPEQQARIKDVALRLAAGDTQGAFEPWRAVCADYFRAAPSREASALVTHVLHAAAFGDDTSLADLASASRFYSTGDVAARGHLAALESASHRIGADGLTPPVPALSLTGGWQPHLSPIKTGPPVRLTGEQVQLELQRWRAQVQQMDAKAASTNGQLENVIGKRADALAALGPAARSLESIAQVAAAGR